MPLTIISSSLPLWGGGPGRGSIFIRPPVAFRGTLPEKVGYALNKDCLQGGGGLNVHPFMHHGDP